MPDQTILKKMELDGNVRLNQALQKLPLRVAKSGLRKAINAGAQPIVKAYRANLPRGSTGLMRKSVKKKTGFSKKQTAYYAVIGMDNKAVGTRNGKPYKPSKIAHLFEGGAKAHAITPKTGPWAGRTLQHPGIAAQHDLQRATEATEGQVRSIVESKLAAVVELAADDAL